MSLLTTFAISSTGLAVQQKRLSVTAENLANINSTHTPEGGPYRRKEVMVSSSPLPFEASLNFEMNKEDIQGAEVMGVSRSKEPSRIVYDPSHPDADEKGFVAFPNINSSEEMVDMMTASRAYESNITVLNAAKTMMMKTLEIGS